MVVVAGIFFFFFLQELFIEHFALKKRPVSARVFYQSGCENKFERVSSLHNVLKF